MEPPPDLDTRRMVLRPFAPADAKELLALFREPGVRRFLLDDVLVTEEWLADEIAGSEDRFTASGTGLWCLRLRGETDIIGFAGFRPFFDPPELQLLYGLLPAYWGRGLATEAAGAMCKHAFRGLGFSRVAASIDAPNTASARVLDRLGMTIRGATGEGPEATVHYVLERSAWEAQQTPGTHRSGPDRQSETRNA